MLRQIFRRSSFAVILVILAMTTPQAGFANQQPSQFKPIVATSPGDIGWHGSFTLNGTGKAPETVAIDGNRVYVAGSFSVAGNVLANDIAMWDGIRWSTLGLGLNDHVTTLAVDGRGNLYAAGAFTQAGGKPALHIARWNGQEWFSLGNGTDDEVMAVAVSPTGDVFVGGVFNSAGGVEAHRIARWDGISWSALDSGISSSNSSFSVVLAISFDRFGYVYAGGKFNQADNQPANNIARWDGSNWSALGTGLMGQGGVLTSVNSLASDGRGNLYAGGRFSTAGGISVNNLAKWNGDEWSDVGGGVQSTKNSPILVKSIIADGNDIYISGYFDVAGGTPVASAAKWNGLSFENLKGGFQYEQFIYYVYGMALDRDGRIFAVGSFTVAGGQCANHVAVWDGGNWSGLGEDNSIYGLTSTILSDGKGGLYFSGEFECAGGQVVNNIAHWDGTTWSGLAGGLTSGVNGSYVRTMAVDHNGNLYAAGNFTQAGNTQVNNIAKWTGTEWEALGEGVSANIYSIVVDKQNHLYAGEYFNFGGNNLPIYNAIYRWNGSQWEIFGTGFDNGVTTLAIDNQDHLVAGGLFHKAGGIEARGLARWNGQAWEALVSMDILAPKSIIIDGETIYGINNTVWKIQNNNFMDLGAGFITPSGGAPMINAVVEDDRGRLIIGGYFINFGRGEIKNIARWNGQNWENLGGGIGDGSVSALFMDESGKLWVAGGFNMVGGKVNRGLAYWKEPIIIWLPAITR